MLSCKIRNHQIKRQSDRYITMANTNPGESTNCQEIR